MSIISFLLRRTDQDVASRGYSAAMKKVLTQTSSRLSVTGLTPAVKKVLKHDPVLLISNHPNQAEVLAVLAALPQRSDYYLIASHNFFSILPSIDKHLIPVFVSHSQITEDKPNLKLRFLRKLHRTNNLDHQEAHQRNIQSIALASAKLSRGSLVQIFPIYDDKKQIFSPGVGYLLNGVKNPRSVKVVMIYVTGTSDFDYLRLIPFVGKLLPPFGINFSLPQNATDFIAATGRQTTNNLEISYRSWVQTIQNKILKPSPFFRFSHRTYMLFRTLVLWFFTNH